MHPIFAWMVLLTPGMASETAATALAAPSSASSQSAPATAADASGDSDGTATATERRGTRISPWRALAWAGAVLTATALATTLAAAATSSLLSEQLIGSKGSRDYDPRAIADAERAGPIAAATANLGLYATAVLLVPTVVLFALPARTTEGRAAPPTTGATGASAEHRP
ncbi:MAG: hypothetical protein JXR83_20650 [Deltaproteobacteria bacterium]|nr:hypothetical protein [Deltaproteobacteria bacterium]